MEYSCNPSQTSITAATKFPKSEVEGCLPENVISSYAKALNILFTDDLDETTLITNSGNESCFGKRTSSLYSIEKNSCVSRIHRSERFKFETLGEIVSFTDIFDSTAKQPKSSPSFENVEVSDELFLPSDIGKEMLLKDEEDHGKEFMYKDDVTCTSYSSWSVCTRKYLSETSLQVENDDLSNRRRYTVGEYIRKFSAPLGTFSDDVLPQNVYFGCNASTPMPDKRVSFNFSKINDGVSNFSMEDQSDCMTLHKTSLLSPMPLYTVKKRQYPGDYRYYIGTANYKNIQRLKEAEDKMETSNFVDKLPFTLNCSNTSIEMTFGFSPRSDETTLKVSTTGASFGSLQGENGVMEQWMVQPQELMLDVNSKGSRLLLMNNSKRDLKFKSRFDSKITNVCPISGILPAKGQIGLRILVSRFIKNRFREDTEDAVIITCGKKEKSVLVKICKEQKSKKFSQKNRSYICF